MIELINRKPSRWRNLTIKEFERDIALLQKACKHLVIRDEYVKQLEKENQQLKDFINETSVETIEKSLEPYYEELEKLYNE